MLIDEIQTLLANDAGVQAQVGTRVYAGTVLPRGYVLPAVLIHTVTTSTDYTFAGSTGQRDATIQFDFYGITEDAPNLAQKAVRAVLKDFTGELSGGSIIQGTFWGIDTDMPFSADLTKTGEGYRSMSHVCFNYVEATS